MKKATLILTFLLALCFVLVGCTKPEEKMISKIEPTVEDKVFFFGEHPSYGGGSYFYKGAIYTTVAGKDFIIKDGIETELDLNGCGYSRKSIIDNKLYILCCDTSTKPFFDWVLFSFDLDGKNRTEILRTSSKENNDMAIFLGDGNRPILTKEIETEEKEEIFHDGYTYYLKDDREGGIYGTNLYRKSTKGEELVCDLPDVIFKGEIETYDQTAYIAGIYNGEILLPTTGYGAHGGETFFYELYSINIETGEITTIYESKYKSN